MTTRKQRTRHAEESTAVATREPAGKLEVIDDLLENAGKGTENINQEDVRPPKMVLAQSTSSQRKRGSADYIDGLEEGFLFNDLTQEVYGEGPIRFSVVMNLGARGVQFKPMDEGGGVIDLNVPLTDPRMQFTDGANGERVKPIATKYIDFLILVTQIGDDRLEFPSLCAWSLKSTGLKTAKELNSLMKAPLKIGQTVLTQPPAWAREYELSTAHVQKDTFSYYVYNLRPAAVTPPETRAFAAELYESYAELKKEGRLDVAVDEEREPGSDDDLSATPFS